MTIRQNLVPLNNYPYKCPYLMTPTRVVIHNTANNASAWNEISYMINSKKDGVLLKTSFHYAVDDKEVVQGVLETRNAWHAGDNNGKGNREGIGIEICYSKNDEDIEKFKKAEDNAVDLIIDILKRYNWGVEKVTKHQDYSGKYCPHRTLDLGWDRFLDKIRIKLDNNYMELQKGVVVDTGGKYNASIITADVQEQRNNYRETRITAGGWFDQWVQTSELKVINVKPEFENKISKLEEENKNFRTEIENLKKLIEEAQKLSQDLTIQYNTLSNDAEALTEAFSDIIGQLSAV